MSIFYIHTLHLLKSIHIQVYKYIYIYILKTFKLMRHLLATGNHTFLLLFKEQFSAWPSMS